MRIASWWMVGMILSAAAVAQDSSRQQRLDEQRWELERRWAIEKRVMEVRPRRRDGPLRYLNITDNEVREIQEATQEYLPRALVNISPVVTGCPCEEGLACADQVYILASVDGRTLGLQLSRISNAWVVGPVQRWWLAYETLKARREKMDYFAYDDALGRLLFSFPQCANLVTHEGKQ